MTMNNANNTSASNVSNNYGKCVFAKLTARLSSRCSSATNVLKIAESKNMMDIYEAVNKNEQVVYVDDLHETVERKYITLTAPNVLETKNDKREMTPGDGQGLCSFTWATTIAFVLGIISRAEFDYIISALSNSNDVQNFDVKARRIIMKVPNVFQIRHGEKKGLLVRANLEAIDCLNGIHVIIPSSVRKYTGKEWNSYPVEVCNWNKKKSTLVNLNAQFIDALNIRSKDLVKIGEYWLNKAISSLNSADEAQLFSRAFSANDEEVIGTDYSFLPKVFSTNSRLFNEPTVMKRRQAQYEALINNLSIGKVPVYGEYTYMVTDPNYLLNRWFGLNLVELHSGEFYHNNKNDEAGLFRSPLIHPFEAQKVTLVEREDLWHYNDVVLFNAYDGTWDRMGGGDFDGDTCAIVPKSYHEINKIIVNGLRELNYDVWEKAPKAKKVEFSFENLFNHLANNARVDRTGIITNHASRWLGICNHLNEMVEVAREKGASYICFRDINKIPTNINGVSTGVMGNSYVPHMGISQAPATIKLFNGNTVNVIPCKDIFNARAIGEIKKDSIDYVFNPGVYTLDEVAMLSEKILEKVAILRILQGREIDGAKTGVFAEGAIEGRNDFTEEVKTKISGDYIINRQNILGRNEIAPEENENSFISLSPLGCLYRYIKTNADRVMSYFAKGGEFGGAGVDKKAYLLSLLTRDELATVTMHYSNVCNIKNAYAINMQKAFSSEFEDTEDNIETVATVKEVAIKSLIDYATSYNIDLSIVAVCAYISANSKNSGGNDGLSFGWLLEDALLKVFGRDNNSNVIIPVSNDTISARIENNVLYTNNGTKETANPFRAIVTNDSDNVDIREYNKRKFVSVTKLSNFVKLDSIVVNSGTQYPFCDDLARGINETRYGIPGFNIYGFTCYNQNAESFINALKNNGFVATIELNGDYLEISINGTVYGSVCTKNLGPTMIILNKKNVQFTSIGKVTKSSIMDCKVIIL